MKLLLIRHAESVFNKLGLIQGQYDCDLSDEGLLETRKFKKTFNYNYDYCYASPLRRTKITAQIITNNGNIIYDDRLMEACFGQLEGTKVTKEKTLNYITGESIPKGAETREHVVRRVKSFIRDLKQKHSDANTILIVTHGGVMRAIQYIYNLEGQEFKNLEIFELDI